MSAEWAVKPEREQRFEAVLRHLERMEQAEARWRDWKSKVNPGQGQVPAITPFQSLSHKVNNLVSRDVLSVAQ